MVRTLIIVIRMVHGVHKGYKIKFNYSRPYNMLLGIILLLLSDTSISISLASLVLKRYRIDL